MKKLTLTLLAAILSICCQAAYPNFDLIKKKLGARESSNKYYEINQLGYIGKYQFGELAFKDVGSPSYQYFKNNIKEFTPVAELKKNVNELENVYTPG